jgi:hypothetical protein
MQNESAPEPIIELVRACLEYVKRSLGTELDFTPETLPLLDHYLSEVREELAAKPELVELTAHAAGAYFGEVLRRQMRGFWHMPSASLHDFQICSSVAFVSINNQVLISRPALIAVVSCLAVHFLLVVRSSATSRRSVPGG